MRNALIYTLAFTAGFTIMSIELLAGRLLAPWFGTSVHVWGSIITVFMVALSGGYLLGGRLSLGPVNLTRFGTILLVGGAAVYPLIPLAEPTMTWVSRYIEDPRYGSLLASTVLFVVPTALLGMISPYSVRLLVKHRVHSGHVAGTLYFASTLGSALGTLATSFYFVLWFRVDHIMLGLVAALCAAGAAAVAFDRLQAPIAPAEATS